MFTMVTTITTNPTVMFSMLSIAYCSAAKGNHPNQSVVQRQELTPTLNINLLCSRLNTGVVILLRRQLFPRN
jgi:hypothetical protein